MTETGENEQQSSYSGPPAPTDANSKPHERLKDISIPLIVAVVALLASITGSVIGGYFTYRTATSTEAAREAADRDVAKRSKTAEVYLAYLDSANKYALASQKFANDAVRASKDPSANNDFSADLVPWQTARSNFQGQINLVYVYGTEAAWHAHQKVAATLPTSVGPDSATEIVQAINGLNWSDFHGAYNGFLTVFCQEVPAERKAHC